MLLHRASSTLLYRNAICFCKFKPFERACYDCKLFSTVNSDENVDEIESHVGEAFTTEGGMKPSDRIVNSRLFKRALMQRLERRTNLPARDINLVLDEFFGIVKEEVIVNNNSVIVKGFGTFKPKSCYKIDPVTELKIDVPGQRNIGFVLPRRRKTSDERRSRVSRNADSGNSADISNSDTL